MTEKAAVLFIHGLGDSGRGWSFLPNQMKLGWITEWVFPDAPSQPVSCNGGMRMPSWFDIIDIPVRLSEPDNPEGLDESVASIHARIKQLTTEHKISSNRILIGGFSQGGLLSLQSALTYPEPLAGCVCLSGWAARRDTIMKTWQGGANAKTRIFWGHGESDGVVQFALGKSCAELLQTGASEGQVQFNSYRGVAHSSCDKEMKDVQKFIADCIPPPS